ncbi:hypothetical protein BBI01_01160 [Chryseobacterium artocarpi]|uniref:RNA polymerase sigma factor 70 region 4 type 2 domain-containing protein n=1 Tax=Chryseobacterium artocarpi TaxID=1414727 RepID=A0A1B8ZZU7_9FLAO|nr:sigma-70 family RNA polymerase sigma factor [Chryseobacterium artocarpi]OCA77100.1 hypothetical protein BBI01_01160 [Chryseobacterium artocarpi]
MPFFSGNKSRSAEDMYKIIYNTYRHRVFSYISVKIQDKNDIRDIMQNVFVHLWQYRNSLGGSNTEKIIFKTCNQETANFFQKQKNRLKPQEYIDDTTDNSDTQIQLLQEKEQQLESVKQLIELLPNRTKEIFTMNKLEGISQKQIASQLNISTKAVEKQISKAMLFLKKNVQNS